MGKAGMGVAGFLLCIVIGIVLPGGAFHCPLHQMGFFLCGLSPLSLMTVKLNTPDLGTGLNLNPSQWMTSLPTPSDVSELVCGHHRVSVHEEMLQLPCP